MNDASQTERPTRRYDWSAVAAIVATLVGLLALCVSAYTADLQRKQVRAQVWPRLLLAVSNTQREMIVVNKGVGPAVIGSVRVYVDGVARRDWASATRAMFGEPLKPGDYFQSTVSDSIISPGESLTMLKFADAAGWARFRDAASPVRRRICFCSTLQECWIVDETAREREESYRPVERCERNEPEEFRE